MSRSRLLTSVPLFRGIAEADREALGGRMDERRFSKGQRIFDQGDKGDSLFIVASGAVTIFLPADGNKGAPEERRVVLREVVQGEHFGELALFDEQPRSASAEAASDAVLLELSREQFVSNVIQSKAAVLAILGEVAQRLRDTNQLLSRRAAKDAVQEIQENLSWAERLADRVAELNGSWTFILCLLGASVAWALFNALAARPFDGYPYVFFNLLLGLMVALQGPLIMMSQNRQSQQDRAQAASDFKVNLKNEIGIERLLVEVSTLRRELEQRIARLEGPRGS
jgi:CRP/FNR family transcriptional regulator, cyclic AMP receptor protein